MRAEKADAFDALIVGSGISGVLMAKRLGQANKKVLILKPVRTCRRISTIT